MQRRVLIQTLKRALKEVGLTYADVARHLAISEASVKRVFHQGDMTLSRVEAITELAGLTLSELMDRSADSATFVSELTRDQEQELLDDPKLLLMAYMLVNGWQPDEVIERFQIEPAEKPGLLKRLRQLGFIDVLPFDRIRVLTARNFRWQPDGPVQRLFLDYVQRDFFDARFNQDGEALYLLGGVLSPASRRQLVRAIKRLAIEIDELSRQDAKLPREDREATGAVLALRAWEFEAFAKLRREHLLSEVVPSEYST